MTRTQALAGLLGLGAVAIVTPSLLQAEVLEASNIIYVGATGVDDKVEIFVDDQLVGSCDWHTSSADCSLRVQVDLGSKTTAKVRFKLTNSVYNGFCVPGPCGKYSGNFYLDSAAGEREWSDSVSCHVATCADGNTAGVKYDKTITWQK